MIRQCGNQTFLLTFTAVAKYMCQLELLQKLTLMSDSSLGFFLDRRPVSRPTAYDFCQDPRLNDTLGLNVELKIFGTDFRWPKYYI